MLKKDIFASIFHLTFVNDVTVFNFSNVSCKNADLAHESSEKLRDKKIDQKTKS
jgi:hypothetical protein